MLKDLTIIFCFSLHAFGNYCNEMRLLIYCTAEIILNKNRYRKYKTSFLCCERYYNAICSQRYKSCLNNLSLSKK